MERPNNQDNGDVGKAKRPDHESLDESTQSSSRARTSLVSGFGGININQQRLSNHQLGSNLTHYHPSASTLEQMRTINYHRNISAVASISSNNVGSIFCPLSNWVQEYPSGSAGQQFWPNLDPRTTSASEVIMSSQPMFQPNISSGASEEPGFRLYDILPSRPNGSGINGSGNSSGINNMSGINRSGNSSGINNMWHKRFIKQFWHKQYEKLLPEGIELKECSCKKTGCLNLYCACFKHGQYCLGCKCQNCENPVENEHAVADARKKALARNADAFSSKVVHNKTEVVVNDEGVEHVQEASILKNGCKCKMSNCAKAYCECNQKQLKCSILCKCTTCRNPKGKMSGNNQVSHVNMSENGQRRRPRSLLQQPPLPPSQPTIQIGSLNNISTTNSENYGLVHRPLQANQPQQVGGNIPHTTPSQASNNGNNNVLFNEMNGSNHGGMPTDLHVNGAPRTQQSLTYADNSPNDLTGSSNNNHNKGNTECTQCSDSEKNGGINSTVISTNGHANQTPTNELLPGSAEMETAPLQNSEVVSSRSCSRTLKMTAERSNKKT